MPKRTKRILILSDTHSGHPLGLTPPRLWVDPQYMELQKITYEWLKGELAGVLKQPIDMLLLNGDLIQGAPHNDTLELITTNFKRQAEIFLECMADLGLQKIKKKRATFGTPIHVTKGFDSEELITENFTMPRPVDTYRFKPNGLQIAARHHGRSSTTPYGQGTQLWKEWVREQLNMMVAEMAEDAADLIIRSHVHYFLFMEMAAGYALSTPCLQLPGSIFGRRMMPAYYDVGFVVLMVNPDGTPHPEKHIMPKIIINGGKVTYEEI